MKHLFVPYAIALLLKEKGFNEPCLTYWFTTNHDTTPQLREKDIMDLKGWTNGYLDSNTIAPLYQQVVDWFREKHEIEVGSPVAQLEKGEFGRAIGWVRVEDENKQIYPTYYAALEAAINHAITLLP